MQSVWVRIALRYFAGILVAKGIFSPDIGDILSTDPEVMAALQVGVGAAIGAAVEFYYSLAKRYGWPT